MIHARTAAALAFGMAAFSSAHAKAEPPDLSLRVAWAGRRVPSQPLAQRAAEARAEPGPAPEVSCRGCTRLLIGGTVTFGVGLLASEVATFITARDFIASSPAERRSQLTPGNAALAVLQAYPVMGGAVSAARYGRAGTHPELVGLSIAATGLQVAGLAMLGASLVWRHHVQARVRIEPTVGSGGAGVVLAAEF